jgi:hypothetical protein
MITKNTKMKTFTVTVERTVIFTEKYEVEAEDAEGAIEIVQEGDLDSFFENDEVVHVGYYGVEVLLK